MMDGLPHEDGDEFGRAAEIRVAFLGELDGGGDAFLTFGQGAIDEACGVGQAALAAEEVAQNVEGTVNDDAPGGQGQRDARPDRNLEAPAKGQDDQKPDGGNEGCEFEEGVKPGEKAGAAGYNAQRIFKALGHGRGGWRLRDASHGNTWKE